MEKEKAVKDVWDWIFSLPLIIALLIIALIAVIYFGARYLEKRERFYLKTIDAKDALIVQLIKDNNTAMNEIRDKQMALYQTAIETEITFVRSIKDMHEDIKALMRK